MSSLCCQSTMKRVTIFFRASYARVRYPLSGADIRVSEVPFSGPRWKKAGCLQTFSASFPRLLFLFVLKSDKNNSSVIWPSVLSSTCQLGVMTVLYFLDFLFNAYGGKKYWVLIICRNAAPILNWSSANLKWICTYSQLSLHSCGGNNILCISETLQWYIGCDQDVCACTLIS